MTLYSQIGKIYYNNNEHYFYRFLGVSLFLGRILKKSCKKQNVIPHQILHKCTKFDRSMFNNNKKISLQVVYPP